MRAVENDVQALEGDVNRRQQVQQVAVFGVGKSADAADTAANGSEVLLVERALDAVFDLVGQLRAAKREELDAIVGHRVVRGRHHDAEVGAGVTDEECCAGRRNDPGVEHVDATRGEARRHRRGQKLARDPRVARDDRRRALARRPQLVGVPPAGENPRSGLRQAEGQPGGEIAVGQPSDPVGTE